MVASLLLKVAQFGPRKGLERTKRGQKPWFSLLLGYVILKALLWGATTHFWWFPPLGSNTHPGPKFWPLAAPLAPFWALLGLGCGGRARVGGSKIPQKQRFWFVAVSMRETFSKTERFWLILGAGTPRRSERPFGGKTYAPPDDLIESAPRLLTCNFGHFDPLWPENTEVFCPKCCPTGGSNT